MAYVSYTKKHRHLEDPSELNAVFKCAYLEDKSPLSVLLGTCVYSDLWHHWNSEILHKLCSLLWYWSYCWSHCSSVFRKEIIEAVFYSHSEMPKLTTDFWNSNLADGRAVSNLSFRYKFHIFLKKRKALNHSKVYEHISPCWVSACQRNRYLLSSHWSWLGKFMLWCLSGSHQNLNGKKNKN